MKEKKRRWNTGQKHKERGKKELENRENVLYMVCGWPTDDVLYMLNIYMYM